MWVKPVLLGLLAIMPFGMFAGGEPEGEALDSSKVSTAEAVAEDSISSTLLLVEALTHAPRDDEYVVIANPESTEVDLARWTLTDGEGSWVLPALRLGAMDGVLLTRNGTALWEDAGLLADACVVGCDRQLSIRGSLALRNQGDGLQLIDPEGRLVDALLYGEAPGLPGWVGDPLPTLARGLVARRRTDDDGWRDSNTSSDWAWNRTFRLGQSRGLPASFGDVPVKTLLSPDDSQRGLLLLLRNAQSRIELAGFTLTSRVLAEALTDALARGVRVQVAVEASPPGGLGTDGKDILGELQRSGARVLLMGAHGEGAWRRYALHHAKYLLIDETWVVVGSENFSPNGYPVEEGNRGWGVALQSPALVSWFHDVLKQDWDESRSDVRVLAEGQAPSQSQGSQANLPPWALSLPHANVTAFLGPDNAATEEGLLGILHHAEERIDVELFYLRWWWGERLNPLVAALLGAAGRGVNVRILLDGTSYNVEGDEDNDEAVRRLNRVATERELPLEARIFFGPSQEVVKLHNKGVLIDGRQVWVSSMNWNLAGAFANREAGLLVESSEVAWVFQRAFEDDWASGLALGKASPPGAPGGDLLLWIGLASGGAAGAWWWVLRTTKESTNKHRRKARTWRRRSKQPSSPSRQGRSRSTRIARSIGGFIARAWGPGGRRR